MKFYQTNSNLMHLISFEYVSYINYILYTIKTNKQSCRQIWLQGSMAFQPNTFRYNHL